MLTEEQARKIAEAHISRRVRSSPWVSGEVVIAVTRHYGNFRIFLCNTKTATQGDVNKSLAGNGPLFVDAQTGELTVGESNAPWQRQFRNLVVESPMDPEAK